MVIGEADARRGGCVRVGHNVHIGYYAQNQDDLMNGDFTVFDTLDRVAVGDVRTRLRDILGAFLFRGEEIDKKVRVLSGGERARLAMARLMLEPYNLLVLDEPTNHMDMRSKDILKNAVKKYDGTVIVISHDREFLDGLVDTGLRVPRRTGQGTSGRHLRLPARPPAGIDARTRPGQFVRCGSRPEFRTGNESGSWQQKQRYCGQVPRERSNLTGETALSGKELYTLKREVDKQLRKAERDVEQAEEQIMALGETNRRMDQQMADPAAHGIDLSDGTVYARYNEMKEPTYQTDLPLGGVEHHARKPEGFAESIESRSGRVLRDIPPGKGAPVRNAACGAECGAPAGAAAGAASPDRSPAARNIRTNRVMENKNMLFGLRPIIEAIEAGRQIEKVYLKKGADGVLLGELAELCRQRRIRVQWVPVEKLNRLAQGNHQGAVALTASIEYVGLHEMLLESIPEDETPLLVVLDGVTDVRNFGAIARSAECAGAHGLVTSLKSSAPVNAESMKSSAGALSLIPVCRAGSIRGTLKILQSEGFRIVAATEKSDKLLFEADLSGPTAIVMGSEDTGISKEVLKLCDMRLAIPIRGSVESLNVSAAAAVMLFEAVRQRTGTSRSDA